MRIAIFDYIVGRHNAIGKCDRLIVEHLKDEHQFTVFAVEFENPDPEKIEFVRIPAIRRPLALLFISYHILAPIILWLYRRRTGTRFDIIQSIESNSTLGTLVYAQFCHKAYLRDHWQATKPSGLRGFARYWDHLLHAWMEPFVYRKARQVVVPSNGLANELRNVYGQYLKDKVKVIPNPVHVGKMRKPADFDSAAFRQGLGLSSDDLVLAFVALGHYERKGLPVLLEAVAKVDNPKVKILSIGGTPSAIEEYKSRATSMGIGDQLVMVGTQDDIRPYLWASDAFAFPSSYETFSMVSFESAAAGLPLMVSPLYGVEEFIKDGVNGWLIPRNADDYAAKIKAALENPELLREMGQNGAQGVDHYEISYFVDHWRATYAAWETAPDAANHAVETASSRG